MQTADLAAVTAAHRDRQAHRAFALADPLTQRQRARSRVSRQRSAPALCPAEALQATIGRKLLIGLGPSAGASLQARPPARRGPAWRRRTRVPAAAYAPELNPVECIWGYLKHLAMPNYCATDFGDLKHRARRHLRSMQRRPALVQAFWQQAELF